MCGIFAYLNYLTPKTRKEVLEKLIGGLQRLEYRGYDSSGEWMWHDVIMHMTFDHIGHYSKCVAKLALS